jgi:ABC-type transport system involved in multi-copper enzyme maturation permease subunit
VTVPSITTTLGSLARVTLLRLARGKTLWVAGVIAAIPIFVLAYLRGRGGMLQLAFDLERDVLSIVPPVFIAATIAEEIEERTATYLWSRPLARWTVIAGKLLALAPIAIAMMCASFVIAAHLGTGAMPPAHHVAALAAGTLAICLASAGIASLVPKHGMALAIIYILADLTIGALPTSLAELSMTHQMSELAGNDAPVTSALALAAISIAWLAAGLRRIRRVEV